jgi:4-hydroxybutyrate CoA-transferase
VKIGIVYCGGCNSGYDRSGFVDTLRTRFPQLEFYETVPEDADFVLTISGCTVNCASRKTLQGRYGRMTVSSPSDFPAVYQALSAILCGVFQK